MDLIVRRMRYVCISILVLLIIMSYNRFTMRGCGLTKNSHGR